MLPLKRKFIEIDDDTSPVVSDGALTDQPCSPNIDTAKCTDSIQDLRVSVSAAVLQRQLQAARKTAFERRISLASSSLTSELELVPHDDLAGVPEIYPNSAVQRIESDLNKVKACTGEMEASDWSSLTNYTDLASPLRYSIKRDPRLELGTNAWLKFWSILHEFPQLTEFDGSSLSSLHLCEAPGAFVAALNHFLAQNHPVRKSNWKWMASSFSPYDESVRAEAIIDDKLIRCTRKHWHFGMDGSGDLRKQFNRESLIAAVKNQLGAVHLVTADGGVDCSDHPEMQEESLTSLKIVEAVTAMLVLDVGGHFVLKIFTVFRLKMVVLLRILCAMFDQADVYKPPTSKAGNSEVYVICRTFRGFSNKNFSVLDWCRALEHDGFPGTNIDFLGSAFINDLTSLCEFFATQQSNAIHANLAMSMTRRHRKIRTAFHKAKQEFSRDYLLRYPIEALKHEHYLLVEEK